MPRVKPRGIKRSLLRKRFCFRSKGRGIKPHFELRIIDEPTDILSIDAILHLNCETIINILI